MRSLVTADRRKFVVTIIPKMYAQRKFVMFQNAEKDIPNHASFSNLEAASMEMPANTIMKMKQRI